ncbi:MAG: GNAT family N-acetyltransferase [Clostridia bacterium]|nr:GNAT family N-acetyltransferase [Clostridia bacterium]
MRGANMADWDFAEVLERLKPGFFASETVRGLAPGESYDDLALPLADWDAAAYPCAAPEGIRFGLYEGDRTALREAVQQVEEDWPQYFTDEAEVYCAFAGDRPVSFAIVSDMGCLEGVRIGGPGCVGTLPEWREKGLGRRVVRDVTALLQARGYGLSYIFYTSYTDWYKKLGYQHVLKWGREGVIAAWPLTGTGRG